MLEGVEKLLLSPFHFVYHCAQDIKGSSCFGVAFGSGHYMKQCHVFQAKSEREVSEVTVVHVLGAQGAFGFGANKRETCLLKFRG